MYRLDLNDNASFTFPKTQNRLKLPILRTSVVLTPPGLSVIPTFDLDLRGSITIDISLHSKCSPAVRRVFPHYDSA